MEHQHNYAIKWFTL